MTCIDVGVKSFQILCSKLYKECSPSLITALFCDH